MDRILFRDVRCFRGEHDIPFAPLTFLVGENSTGKSTILAMTRVAWDVGHAREEPDFNEEPFQLGAFGEIANLLTKDSDKEAVFSVGFKRRYVGHKKYVSTLRTAATFTSRSGQVMVASIGVQNEEDQSFVLLKEGSFKWSLGTRSGQFNLGSRAAGTPLRLASLWVTLELWYDSQSGPDDLSLTDALILKKSLGLEMPHVLPSGWVVGGSRPIALAPVRTRPRRTYDPLRETRSPEGDHVPMLLARLRATDAAAWEALAADLAEYGRGAGLFSDLLVRRFDGNEASPFQLQVRLAGQSREVNLIDVGYGVSQVLPILVDAFTQPEESSFLLQQPEVHLHPKAQAELGSMLVSLVKRRRHKFMIETHSDHLVDRVRLEVKRGKIPAEDVRIVYCERADSHVLTHEIKVDANGNLIGAPEGYRQFFLDEELALLGG